MAAVVLTRDNPYFEPAFLAELERTRMRPLAITISCLIFIIVGGPVSAGPLTITSDFITDANRTAFNGFEGMTVHPWGFYADGTSYTEGGITVRQVNDEPDDIYATFFSPEGQFGWYPNGGDRGYTRITLTTGTDFGDVGFFRTSGNTNSPISLFFELYDDAVLVLEGTAAQPLHFQAAYLGWKGGGFDEIRVWDNCGLSNGANCLALDAIEMQNATTVPEPASGLLTLLGVTIVGAATRSWRHRAQGRAVR